MKRRRERSANDDPFGVFFAAHLDRAHRLAWRLLGGDNEAAEAVVQEAFVRAHRSFAGPRGDASPETWFFRILIRTAQNQNRWQWLRRSRRNDRRRPQPAPAEATTSALRQRRLSAAVGRLPAGQRDAFVLVHLEGFTVQESSALLGKTEGIIRSRSGRAVQKLRAELGDLARGEDRDDEEPELRTSVGRSPR